LRKIPALLEGGVDLRSPVLGIRWQSATGTASAQAARLPAEACGDPEHRIGEQNFSRL
jgi:hypothetical protein